MKSKLVPLFFLGATLATITLFSSRPVVLSQTSKASLSPAEQELLTEINLARTNPQVYAGYLEKLKPLFKGKQYTAEGSKAALQTQEGWSAVEEAIKFLRAAKPAVPLTTSSGLYLAAMAHVKDQSASGSTGHKGGNLTMIEDRVKPYGNWQGGIGENLSYGDESARERLLTWLIDDGFANRGHRNRLMSDSYKVAGLSCGPHPEYRTMCCLTVAGGFSEPSAQTSAVKSTSANTSVKTSNSNTAKSKSSGASTNSNKPGTTPTPRKY